MSLAVSIDPDDPTPPYEQLRRQLGSFITSGALPPGTRLSPVRRLAADLELANGTVARAYRELETAGLVSTRRGGGTIVTEPDQPVTDPRSPERHADLDSLAVRFVEQSRGLGVSDDGALDAVRAAQTSAPRG